MTKHDLTVFKSGNSYALRVPKQYAETYHLQVGEKISVGAPVREKKQDRAKIQKLLEQLQEMKAFSSIKDPVAWQREIRKDRPLAGRDY